MKPISTQPDTLLNGLLLGWTKDDNGKLTPLWDTNREGHLLTVAPTGAGKGVSCAIPALLTWNGPAVVIDPRGENYAVTSERRRAMGHIVYRLDPFQITGTGPSDSLNPLDLVDPHADDFEDNAAVVAQLCMQNLTDTRDPYWDERASVLITKIICELYRQFPNRQPSLRSVQDAIQGQPVDHCPEATVEFFKRIATPEQLADFEKQKPKRKTTLDLSKVVTATEFASERTRACIFSTANSHLGFLKSPAVYASLTNSTIMLDDITGGAMHTIYLVIPPDKLVTHRKLLRLWIGVMLAAIGRRKKTPPLPTLFLIDEAAQLGPMDELRSALTLMRAYGVRVWTFWQCLSQIASIYPTDWETIINNSAIHQFFGAKTPYSKKQIKAFLGDDMPKGGIPPDQQLIFDGEELRILDRANYLNDPLLRGLASKHPFHESAAALAR